MNSIYNSAIIGCGRIGVFYSRPEDKKGIMTHAHAYKKDPRVNISAFMDIDFKKAKKAAGIWGGNAYDNLDEMFKREKINIVSICVPDELHEDILIECLKYKPKAVFCEKPLTLDIKSAEKIVKDYHKAGILLAVNFTRRWKKSVIKLKKGIKENKYGKVLNISGIYTKGILHNGSHLIDMLRYLFGDIKEVTPLSARIDWKKTDPTIDAFLKFNNGASAHILGADEGKYSVFDLDILFEKARFYFTKFGNELIYYEVKPDKISAGYKKLEQVCSYKTDDHGILNAVSNLINVVEGREVLVCSGADALAAQKICHMLFEKYKKMRLT